MIIDTHLHIYPADEGRRLKQEHQITEYGDRDGVEISTRDGSVEDALAAISDAEASYAVVLNHFIPGGQIPSRPSDSSSTPAAALVSYNEWVCDVCQSHQNLVPFIGIDPWILGPTASAAHLREYVEQRGARGVKLHPPLQFFYPDDERMIPTYAECVDLDTPIVAHAGPDRGGAGYGDPVRWAGVLAQFPRLKLVLAHLGGGYWPNVPEFASAYPSVRFDLSEIINWVGGTRAPSPTEFSALIRDVGATRVMFGSDFPWYDLDTTIDLIQSLPGLGPGEREQILGLNAAEFLNVLQ